MWCKFMYIHETSAIVLHELTSHDSYMYSWVSSTVTYIYLYIYTYILLGASYDSYMYCFVSSIVTRIYIYSYILPRACYRLHVPPVASLVLGKGAFISWFPRPRGATWAKPKLLDDDDGPAVITCIFMKSPLSYYMNLHHMIATCTLEYHWL